MLRTFSEHDIRLTESLCGIWDFCPENEVKKKNRYGIPLEYTRKIFVPSCWETIPGFECYRGKAWFRTTVPSLKGKALRIVFGGVSHTGTVYLNNKKVGWHYDAFTPWDVIIPNCKEGINELVIYVDNTFGEHSALHRINDYYTYGGITRPVELQYIPLVFLERLHAKPGMQKSGKWNLEVTVRIRNCSNSKSSRKLVVSVADKETGIETVIPPQTVKSVKLSFKDLDVEPWSAVNPSLYYIEALLIENGNIVDDLIDRIGFRQVEVKGKKLLLNGEPIRLRGFNRHEDHPLFGNSIPVEAMVYDLQLIRDLGGNFIRTSHYPNDMRFLDLCDELGFYVWEESHARSVPFDAPHFLEQINKNTEEMIDWHYNHPSIIIWGCLNECESFTPSGKKIYEKVINLIRKNDNSRPVTFASNHAEKDLCFGLVDIVSWNRYDAWYKDWPSSIEPELKRVLKWLHSDKSHGGKGKPVIMSEFGGAAIYGCRSRTRAKWTEEYQCDLLDESLRVYLHHPDIVGACIWQFCDIRVEKQGTIWKNRPRTMNNKGVVDEYRRPKLAYDIVKARIHEAIKLWDLKLKNNKNEKT